MVGKRRDLTPNSLRRRKDLPTPRWFWPLVIVAMATTFFYSLPRMTHGFWDDEELNVRTTLWGKFKPNKKTGEVEVVRFDWLETIYGYSKGPNTRLLASFPARAKRLGTSSPSQRAFHWSSGRFVCRHSFLASWQSRLSRGYQRISMPATGVVAAWLLAVHPWSIRYASEARGYSFVIFIVPVLFVFWRRAMVTGFWRWWSAYALAEFRFSIAIRVPHSS